MPEAASDPLTAEAAEEQARPWRDEHIENVLNTRLGYEGMMLDKLMKQNQDVRTLAKQARDGTIGKGGEAAPEPDEMGVNIGNKTFISNNYPATQEAAVSTPAPSKSGMSTAAKVGVGAALLAAGAGLPAAGLVAGSLLADRDPPAVVAPLEIAPPAPAVDRDTYLPYQFGIE